MHTVFVYGTLKEGFRNHVHNQGTRRPGCFESVLALPLYIVGDRCLPWLLNRPGQGIKVTGELYDCDNQALARMDALEGTDTTGWYERRQVLVRAALDTAPDSGTVPAWVYFGSEAGFARSACHWGPIAEYTQAYMDALVGAHGAERTADGCERS